MNVLGFHKPIFKIVRKRIINTRLQILVGIRGFMWGKLTSQGHLQPPFPEWNGVPVSLLCVAPQTHLVVQQASGVSESLRAGRASIGPFTSV